MAALLPLVGGMLGPLRWMLVPSIVLCVGGVVWLLVAVMSLSPSEVLRRVALALMFAPMIATPLCAMQASQALVLQARGVSRSAAVTRIEVHHGKSTTYDCTVRYDGSATPVTDTVACGAEDRAGEHVVVVRDPGGLVDPEFDWQVSGARADVVFAVMSEIALMVFSVLAVAVGAVIHIVRRRRADASRRVGAAAETLQLRRSSAR
ncbi:hypothetical protein BIV25_21225 [Streptomyces sp. MUSC 14]|uniref:hypothetical protein n=1 Tax=Streptomyces sp. MUSC 14 TaxID=1354889 RepID=UPI0008F5DDC8|nr:hypothetical protein [Streptomyces sp. MUSC 14]OIJ94911.1 hypothetical protein BIV25_21225 [Streptomyces sp. MUSC 14]